MGSLLEPAEIRYTIISLIALTVMTSMLGFMALGAAGPFAADTGNVSVDNSTAEVDPSNPATYNEWQPDDSIDLIDGGFFSFLGTFFEFMTDAIAFPFIVMNRWVVMVANAGWASMFIVIPSIAMLLVVVNSMYKIAKAIPYT